MAQQAAPAPSGRTAIPVVPVQAVTPAPDPAAPAPTTYKIGDKGPAGGIIFYVNPQSEDWKYLEAAPANTERAIKWGNITVKGTGVGEGKKNTELIVAALNDQGENGAAFFCEELEVNGFDDWFLPSRGDLNLMYTRLKEKGLGGFKSEMYWASSQIDSERAWCQSFSNGNQISNFGSSGKYITTYYVRAIRQF
jgi:hypothetical protein